mmetsp:Transcript_29238/g.75298  ORF Transcript_29238/g.75298 Transcript_29238/m.75298 type:complete len:297 (+) Transcript_29238:152-1042(+)
MRTIIFHLHLYTPHPSRYHGTQLTRLGDCMVTSPPITPVMSSSHPSLSMPFPPIPPWRRRRCSTGSKAAAAFHLPCISENSPPTSSEASRRAYSPPPPSPLTPVRDEAGREGGRGKGEAEEDLAVLLDSSFSYLFSASGILILVHCPARMSYVQSSELNTSGMRSRSFSLLFLSFSSFSCCFLLFSSLLSFSRCVRDCGGRAEDALLSRPLCCTSSSPPSSSLSFCSSSASSSSLLLLSSSSSLSPPSPTPPPPPLFAIAPTVPPSHLPPYSPITCSSSSEKAEAPNRGRNLPTPS